MMSRRPFRLLTAVLLVMLASPAAAQPAPAAPALELPAPDMGFVLEVRGRLPDGVAAEEFGRRIAAALPEPLADPQRNFTKSSAYRPEADYRLVMVFHGPEPVEAARLCDGVAATPDDQAPQAPRFDDLGTTNHVTAALCESGTVLSTAADRIAGELRPEQASFRFLVADVIKQLFPSGFDTLPGSIPGAAPAPAGAPPG
ncbi:hypothetical protein [Rhodospirillum centenum]|uniref:Lipoprotein n=1 Tax=Rhodospirillum centenum (strain ATCC 51521 / SW) TaxID=414684 RepID=B6IPM8_RHOCS|nr:hypothetical protein [Rhodospirillum centenum]ACI99730.1 hypothetical protein RC1_2344 [Rhodospirillum centenum SW]